MIEAIQEARERITSWGLVFFWGLAIGVGATIETTRKVMQKAMFFGLIFFCGLISSSCTLLAMRWEEHSSTKSFFFVLIIFGMSYMIWVLNGLKRKKDVKGFWLNGALTAITCLALLKLF